VAALVQRSLVLVPPPLGQQFLVQAEQQSVSAVGDVRLDHERLAGWTLVVLDVG
jgi:hypothetical protein